jgi:hypothetical protein
LERLRAENARLNALLEAHNIEWRLQPEPPPKVDPIEPELSALSTAAKVALFHRLFRGRTDVYPVRGESNTTGKSGYAPAFGRLDSDAWKFNQVWLQCIRSFRRVVKLFTAQKSK